MNSVFARLLVAVAAFAATQFVSAVIDELQKLEQRAKEEKRKTVIPTVLRVIQGGRE